MPGYSPVRTKPEMTTPEQEASATTQTAGDANHNWNLRDRLGGIEDYEAAVKKGFVGSQEDWHQFLTECEEHNPIQHITVEGEPNPQVEEVLNHEIPPTATPIPDLVVRIASRRASKLTVQYRSAPYVRLVLWLAAAMMIVVAALGLAFVQVYTKSVTRERLDRPVACALSKDGVDITGTRNYSYINNSFGPYHWHDDATLLEKTTINVSMNGLTVVMITDGESKTMRRGQAEGGVMILPKADYYTFFSNGKATGASYAELCK